MVLDGATGTLVSAYGMATGNTDSLNISHPKIVADIHRRYLAAGADIITTNTFSSQRISQSDYHLEDSCRDMALAGARIARRCADEFSAPSRPRFVAGSIGPTNKTASLSPSVNDPADRDITYDALFAAYSEEVEALLEGGVDLMLIETIFDTLNCKAALAAAQEVMAKRGRVVPIMVSVTLSDLSGRTLSGQTLEAFLASLSSFPIFSVGLNCGLGARQMKPFLRQLAARAPYYVSAYPNAGLPNEVGLYEESPEIMCREIENYIDEELVNIVGGCCGTDDRFISLFAAAAEGRTPRVPRPRYRQMHLAGLSPFVPQEGTFTNIGERCNVAGSRRFLRLISEKRYDEAVDVARRQVADGALVLDINMDNGLLDAEVEMAHFVCLLASEPDIAAVPLMIDSSKWEVIERALKCIQGKCIVNSISLKEGEQTFIERAKKIKAYGAAVVVMCFDEEGQATTYERKIAIAQRAYRLLTEKVNFNPLDLLFDPNILSVATGMKEDAAYALDFLKATRWIRTHCPRAHVSGGVSNLSFAFRGNDYLREAMHAVFLYHAIDAGMDFGIANPATQVAYADIPQHLLTLIEDVILNRCAGAAEALTTEAGKMHEGHNNKNTESVVGAADEAWRCEDVAARLKYALKRGISTYLAVDLSEALECYAHAVDIIEGPLMEGMNEVGQLFGEGKMFLPQVVKTARTMKDAVATLQPHLERQKGAQTSRAGKIVIATVRGDVHDIGKNIVVVVMECNNFEVIDLGVMVDADKIVSTAQREAADIVCLSGLITPSLEEMVVVARNMQVVGMETPLMVGGATTSELHVALRLATEYKGIVVWARDAASSAVLATRLMNISERVLMATELTARYKHLREEYTNRRSGVVSIEEARRNKPNYFAQHDR